MVVTAANPARRIVTEINAEPAGDRGLLERVIRNFVSNAIRYTDSGRVLIGCRSLGEKVSVETPDTGIGIPEDKRFAR